MSSHTIIRVSGIIYDAVGEIKQDSAILFSINKLYGEKILIIAKGLIFQLITGTSRICKGKAPNFGN